MIFPKYFCATMTWIMFIYEFEKNLSLKNIQG